MIWTKLSPSLKMTLQSFRSASVKSMQGRHLLRIPLQNAMYSTHRFLAHPCCYCEFDFIYTCWNLVISTWRVKFVTCMSNPGIYLFPAIDMGFFMWSHDHNSPLTIVLYSYLTWNYKLYKHKQCTWRILIHFVYGIKCGYYKKMPSMLMRVILCCDRQRWTSAKCDLMSIFLQRMKRAINDPSVKTKLDGAKRTNLLTGGMSVMVCSYRCSFEALRRPVLCMVT